MKSKYSLLILLLFISFNITAGNEAYIKHYLSDTNTAIEIKEAIKNKKVIKGMCPFQAFAAAGMPGPYMVIKDRSLWSSNVPPPVVIQAQCKKPDKSIVELMFRNTSQFNSKEPVVFRVRFEKGKSVLIDKQGFTKAK